MSEDVNIFFLGKKVRNGQFQRFMAIFFLPTHMTFYGNWANFYGGHGGRAHIYFGEADSRNTHRIASSFLKQLKDCIVETVIFGKPEDTIIHQLSDQDVPMNNTSNLNKKINLLGEYRTPGTDTVVDHTAKFNFPNNGSYKINVSLEKVNDDFVINHWSNRWAGICTIFSIPR